METTIEGLALESNGHPDSILSIVQYLSSRNALLAFLSWVEYYFSYL